MTRGARGSDGGGDNPPPSPADASGKNASLPSLPNHHETQTDSLRRLLTLQYHHEKKAKMQHNRCLFFLCNTRVFRPGEGRRFPVSITPTFCPHRRVSKSIGFINSFYCCISC